MKNRVISFIIGLILLVSSAIPSIALAQPFPYFDIVFIPESTHVEDGLLKIRFNYYPSEDNLSYEKHHLYVAILPKDGYTKRDKDGNIIDIDDYEDWYNSLPHKWIVTPVVCQFISISPDTTKEEILEYLNSKMSIDVLSSLDLYATYDNPEHYISPLFRDKTSMVSIQSSYTKSDIDNVNTKFADFALTNRSLDIEPLEVIPESIDIGTVAENKSATVTARHRTKIEISNPANASGIIDTYAIYGDTHFLDLYVGTHYLVSGTTYKCRDSEHIGAVDAGYQVFTGLSISVEIGDVASLADDQNDEYTDIDTDYGTSTIMGVTGLYMNTDDEAEFSAEANRCNMAIYGTGSEEEEEYPLSPPYNFFYSNLGAITTSINWTAGVNSTYTMIRASTTDFPTLITDGELIYYGASTNLTSTDFLVDKTYYASGWGFDSDNTTYSDNYTTFYIGGEDMVISHLLVLIPLTIFLILSLIFYGKGLVHILTFSTTMAIAYMAIVGGWELLFFPILVVTALISIILFSFAMMKGGLI